MQLFDGCAIAAVVRAPGPLAACSGSGHRLLIAVKQGAPGRDSGLGEGAVGRDDDDLPALGRQLVKPWP